MSPPPVPAPSQEALLALNQSHAAFWRLPLRPLSEGQLARLLSTTMRLNATSSRGVAHLNLPTYIAASDALALGPDAIDSPLRFLALSRLRRTKLFQPYHGYGTKPAKLPAPDWFELDKPVSNIGMECLRQRKGSAAKSILAAGCHPALFFFDSWDATRLPSPKEAASALLTLAATCSLDACKSLFNALDASCSDPALFRSEFAEATRIALRGVWLEREGVANASERIAVAQCAFAFERLSKKKSLPADLALVLASVDAKRASFSDTTTTFEFSSIQTQRMKALFSTYAHDDLQAFAALVPLCGLDSPEAFESGVPASSGIDWPPGKYWGTKLSSQSAFACSALLFDMGENPWLCAGDGQHAVTAEGNPFTWIASHARAGEKPGFPAFASAVARAALRDAETRQPGNGLSSCLEAFDLARAHRPALWSMSGPGPAIAIAACEQALFPSMMSNDSAAASENQQAPSAPTPSRRSRL